MLLALQAVGRPRGSASPPKLFKLRASVAPDLSPMGSIHSCSHFILIVLPNFKALLVAAVTYVASALDDFVAPKTFPFIANTVPNTCFMPSAAVPCVSQCI